MLSLQSLLRKGVSLGYVGLKPEGPQVLNNLKVLEVVRAPSIGGHWKLSCRMVLLVLQASHPPVQQELSRPG
jgi:hypothetical protein